MGIQKHKSLDWQMKHKRQEVRAAHETKQHVSHKAHEARKHVGREAQGLVGQKVGRAHEHVGNVI